MKKNFKIQAKIWKWPGEAPWHFVTLDKKLSAEIREVHGKGMIPIKTTIGKTTWDNVLFPHKIDQAYILAVKKMVRKNENIWEGDVIKVSFSLR